MISKRAKLTAFMLLICANCFSQKFGKFNNQSLIEKEFHTDNSQVNSESKFIANNKQKVVQVSNSAFEENKGQIEGKDAKKVLFRHKSNNVTIFLFKNGLAYQHSKNILNNESSSNKENDLIESLKLETYRMDIELVGSNLNATVTKEGKSIDYVNYYNKCTYDVCSYSKIVYNDVYPNIDWVLYKSNSGIKYDFIVRPGGDPSMIRLKTKWVEQTKLSEKGGIILSNRLGSISEMPPLSFQGDKIINTKFILNEDEISFKLDNYNVNQTLIIDPSVVWGTYYGGGNLIYTIGEGCATDINNNVYLSGNTFSDNSIASGGHDTIRNGRDAFLVKFNESGARLWATYYGGLGLETGTDVCVDKSNNVYLSGLTNSNQSIATFSGMDTSGGLEKHFLVKFNSNGGRIWATYSANVPLSFYLYDRNTHVTADKLNNVYLSGTTGPFLNSNLVFNGHDTAASGATDAFLVKYDSLGTRLWATFYGGDNDETNEGGCVVDNNLNVYLTGSARSNAEIAYKGFDSLIGGGIDLFLVKFNSNGVRQWGTYFGGNADELSNSCAIDSLGNVYFAGSTRSSGLGFLGYDTLYDGAGYYDLNGLLVKFDSFGNRIWSTYVGDSFSRIYGISCDNDAVYATGFAFHSIDLGYLGFNIVNKEFDAFLSKIDLNGGRVWSTYIGELGDDEGYSCVSDRKGKIYVAGITNSYVPFFNGGYDTIASTYTSINERDAFLIKIDTALAQYSASIVITSSNITLCRYDTILLKSKITYGGSNPKYRWFKNNTVFDTIDSTFVSSLSNNDTIQCLLISNSPFVFEDSVWSNKIGFTIFKLDTTFINDLHCYNPSLPYNFRGKQILNSGIYIDTLVNLNGCDSFIFLNLKVNHPDTVNIMDSICSNQSYNFGGRFLTNAGIYYDTLLNLNGCDSFVTLNLIVKSTSKDSINKTICSGTKYNFNGNNFGVSGIYTDTLLAANGCDSFVKLNLTVLPKANFTLTVSLCKGKTYLFNGIQRGVSGTYLDTFTAANGCDSIVTLSLTILAPTVIVFTDSSSFASAYTWRGKSYTTASTYYDTSVATNKCDTIFKLVLTSITPPSPAAAPLNVLYSNGALYASIDSATNYQWYLCGPPMKKIKGATKRFFQVSDKSIYTVVVTKNGKTDTAACRSNSSIVIHTGFSNLHCFPNPVLNTLNIELGTKHRDVSIDLMANDGRILWSKSFNEIEKTTIDMHTIAQGIYYIHFQSSNGVNEVIKILKSDD